MRGIRIIFGDTGPTFDLEQFTLNFASTVQNALVNVGTRVGSDPIFAERGTGILDAAVKGALISSVWATHYANFAALETLSFSRTTDDDYNLFKLQKFTLESTGLVDQHVALNASAISTDGQMIGTNVTL